MSNLEMLQKLSLGTKEIHEVTIETDDGEEYDFKIRPLSDGELTQLQVIEKKPYSMKMKINRDGEREPVKREDKKEGQEMDVDMGEFTEVQAKAIYTAIAWSLSVDDEKIPVKIVQGLPLGVPEILFEKVIEISHLTEKDLSAIKNFRKF